MRFLSFRNKGETFYLNISSSIDTAIRIFAEYDRLRSETERRRTVFTRNFGHSRRLVSFDMGIEEEELVVKLSRYVYRFFCPLIKSESGFRVRCNFLLGTKERKRTESNRSELEPTF